MSEPVQPHPDPSPTPVGHSRASVEIHEYQAWAISGWLGVLVVAVCIVAVVLASPGRLPGQAVVVIAPIVVGVVILASLTIVQPGQTRVVRFFGR